MAPDLSCLRSNINLKTANPGNAGQLVYFFVYGLQLTSDRPIPGLVPIDALSSSTPDLHVQFESGSFAREGPDEEGVLWFASQFIDEKGNPTLVIRKASDSGDFLIRYSQGLEFRLDATLTRIEVHRPSQMSEKEVALYLLGPVLGIVLRLKGLTCLHASAVEIDSKAVAFAGEMGSGKSTTAAIFAQNGHAVLTDDIAPLQKSGANFRVYPGYPCINLLPDSFALFSGELGMARTSEPVSEKVKLTLNQEGRRFQDKPMSLALIYVLGSRSKEASAVTVDAMAPQETLIALASNTYANRILDTTMRAQEFHVLGELVRTTPVRKLIAPARSPDVRSLYQAIFNDARAVMKSRA